MGSSALGGVADEVVVAVLAGEPDKDGVDTIMGELDALEVTEEVGIPW